MNYSNVYLSDLSDVGAGFGEAAGEREAVPGVDARNGVLPTRSKASIASNHGAQRRQSIDVMVFMIP